MFCDRLPVTKCLNITFKWFFAWMSEMCRYNTGSYFGLGVLFVLECFIAQRYKDWNESE